MKINIYSLTKRQLTEEEEKLKNMIKSYKKFLINPNLSNKTKKTFELRIRNMQLELFEVQARLKTG